MVGIIAEGIRPLQSFLWNSRKSFEYGCITTTFLVFFLIYSQPLAINYAQWQNLSQDRKCQIVYIQKLFSSSNFQIQRSIIWQHSQ